MPGVKDGRRQGDGCGDYEMEEGHLCGDQLVLYLGCSSGYTDIHMG